MVPPITETYKTTLNNNAFSTVTLALMNYLYDKIVFDNSTQKLTTFRPKSWMVDKEVV